MTENKKDNKLRSISINLLSGSISGIASTAVCHPMDTLRTRLQASTAHYNGALDCLVQTVKNEGFMALYQGLSAPLAAQAVYKAVIFGTNSQVRPLLPNTGSQYGEVFIGGFVSGAVNSFVVTPVELVRNRLMVQNRAISGVRVGPRDIVAKVLRQDGIVGLWRGLLPTLMRDAPGVGCWFVGFDFAKDAFRYFSSDPKQPLPFWKTFAAGSFGGMAFWAVALPVDTVKSVYQIQEQKTSLLTVTRKLIAEKGLFYLFRAWPVAFGRGIPGAAVTLTTYDMAYQYLNKKLN
jgi:solute carrier family 25 carnitine/acylcarnitine transporter 20/29